MKKHLLLLSSFLATIFSCYSLYSQDTVKTFSDSLIFRGQVSAWSNYYFDSPLPFQIGGRYIPTLEYDIQASEKSLIDFEIAANIYGTFSSSLFDSTQLDGNINPYRLWTRFSTNQFELRLGLQKIDFGSATLLRPLQWFNAIDPRDPLKITNGVYGVLSRYYFLNNANIWAWFLYGNEKTRGFDAIETYSKHPEFGGRIQYPTLRGEIAISYNHRTANAQNLFGQPEFAQIPEDRIGLDGKWDLIIGLWLEATHIIKHRDIGILTNQSLFNLGTDYTFGIGNGLNIIVEHLFMSYSQKSFDFNQNLNFTACNISYPLGFFDNISTMAYYNWKENAMSFFLNYSHQFNKVAGYIMVYYNPKTQQMIQQNELLNISSGPGVQIMLVYNH